MFTLSEILFSRGTMARAAMVGHRLKKDVLRRFLDNSYRVWGTKYDYSIAELKHPNVPVKIICKQHGAFLVSPREHLHLQRGCPECSTERRVRKKETQAALPSSPDLKEFMKQLSPGQSKLKKLGLGKKLID
jgi:hypothetical protein